mmetsp:Transcript_22459/g.51760  ORF Transcript_22459/g.51760 Transcript_22459/m.51760 type:complete len:227 (+) Transcript_22459:1435-2115(+)
MLTKNIIDALLVFGIDIANKDRLSWTDHHIKIVFVADDSESSLETKATLVLHTAAFHMLSVEELTISLLPPTHPVIVLPLLNLPPWLDLLPIVALYQLAEVVDSKSMNQVLHTGIRTNVSISMITLTRQDALHDFHDIFLGNIPQVICSPRKCVGFIVRAAKATTHHDIETLELTIFVRHNHNTNVVRVDVDGIVSWDSDTDLEFAWQVAITIEGLHRTRKDGSTS